jgi:hypothetical protein
MPSRQRPGAAQRNDESPYRSFACHIGTHMECRETQPHEPSKDLPVIYEACHCGCHPPANSSTRRNSEEGA